MSIRHSNGTGKNGYLAIGLNVSRKLWKMISLQTISLKVQVHTVHLYSDGPFIKTKPQIMIYREGNTQIFRRRLIEFINSLACFR